MFAKLTAGSLALLAVLMVSLNLSAAPDEKKAKRPAGPPPSVFGMIDSVSEDGKTIVVKAKTKKGEPPAPDKTVKIDDETVVEVKTEDKKLVAGLLAAVWLKEGSEDTAAKVTASPAKKKKKDN